MSFESTAFVFATLSEASLTFLRSFCLWGPCGSAWKTWVQLLCTWAGSHKALRGHSRLWQLSYLKPPESRRWVKGKTQRKVCAVFFNTLVTFSRALVNQVCLPFATLGGQETLYLFRLRQNVWVTGSADPDPQGCLPGPRVLALWLSKPSSHSAGRPTFTGSIKTANWSWLRVLIKTCTSLNLSFFICKMEGWASCTDVLES